MSDQESSNVRLHAIVRGRVQGVNFRYYTIETARRLGLKGWVANRRDGTVETVAEGDRDAVEDLLEFLHRGSPAARVQDVDAKWQTPTNEFEGFQVRFTR